MKLVRILSGTQFVGAGLSAMWTFAVVNADALETASSGRDGWFCDGRILELLFTFPMVWHPGGVWTVKRP